MTMISLQPVLKLTGFCNMRCAYCLETPRLDDPTRMSLDVVGAAAKGFIELAASLARALDAPVGVDFILHGGEPLILPPTYLAEVCETLRTAGPPTVGRRLHAQTNALALSDAALAIVDAHEVRLSASHDVIPGSRVNAAGKSVDGTVEKNLWRLRETGRLHGGITVVNLVTAPHLDRVHAFWRDLGVPYRLLPLFAHGGPRIELYGLSEADSAAALGDLLELLLDRGESVDMEPLRSVLGTALAQVAGIAVAPMAGPAFGRTTFVVNNDGRLYDQTVTDYAKEKSVGDLRRQTLGEILSGPGIDRLHAADAEAARACCGGCAFARSCSRWPLMDDGVRGLRCGISFRLMERAVAALRKRGVGEEEARAILGIASAPARRLEDRQGDDEPGTVREAALYGRGRPGSGALPALETRGGAGR